MITQSERAHLRELAKRQLEIANLPIMAERERLWRLHNALQGERPMIVMEEITFLNDLLPPFQCESPDARFMERALLQNLAVHKWIDDDKVIPASFAVPLQLRVKLLGQAFERIRVDSGSAYHIEPVLETLSEDMGKLTASDFSFDAERDASLCALVEDTLGDILPVRRINAYNHWAFTITQIVVDLMGMENMYCAMMDEPDEFHSLMALITEDRIACLRWQEREGLLRLNNGNDYMGSGSYCFTDELPLRPVQQDALRSTDLWGHLNSQESVGISPGMFREFIYPYYERLAAEFGLVYYGCCEPVHALWDSLAGLPNLRKVSISPWCDEEIMAGHLKNSRIIYSRKPSPNFLGIEAALDEQALFSAMRHTAELTKDCKAEVIFRDVYTLNGNMGKVRRAVELTREAFGIG